MNADKQTILVVEDDEDTRKTIEIMLDSLGYRVLSFGSPLMALEKIKGQKIDLALLDIMMPEMDGYQLMKRIKQMEEFGALPVVMVTAKDAETEILEGYQSGADYYIPKPFTRKQLVYGIELFLGRS
jgi:CheY-like chemotaxis protein